MRLSAKQESTKPSLSWLDGFDDAVWLPAIRKGFMFALLFSLLLVSNIYAENLYVTPSGAGSCDGSNWQNALAGFSGVKWGSGKGKLGADDTLWIAGGTYSSYVVFGDSGTAGHLINIKRATANDTECTSAAGWSAGFDSQVVISGTPYGFLLVNESLTGPGRYTVVDGRTTDGIRVNVSEVSNYHGIHFYGQGSFKTIFRYIGLYGPAKATPNYPWTCTVDGISLGFYGKLVERLKDLTFEYCTISGFNTGIMVQSTENLIVQYCDINTNGSSNPSIHANNVYVVACENFKFRYNIVHDTWCALGIIFANSGKYINRNIYIYGNIFRDGAPLGEKALAEESGALDNGPFYIYNNTFVRVWYAFLLRNPLYTEAKSYFQNNLMVDVTYPLPGGDPSLIISDNVANGRHNLFLDWGSTGVLPAPYDWQFVRNLDLKAGTSPGATLGSEFAMDLLGRPRGGGEAWDIGAYQHIGSTRIMPPNNLRVIP